MSGAERRRVEQFGQLEDGLRQGGDWYLWGPYVSERQWGTVREDYSESGDAWSYLPFDHARSRAYRWGEDGLAGFSDIEQRLCLGLSLWNGRDAFLKERPFGLAGPQGNHGEDVKDYWWYVDATPSHSWNRWRYHYPQGAFPYDDLVAENGRRGKFDPEYELLDTGAFDDDRYWIVEVDYAKADPTDLLMVVRVTNSGPETDTVHVLPTAWFRNTWSWEPDAARPSLAATSERAAAAAEAALVAVDHPFLGELELLAGDGPDGPPELLFCENETNAERLFGSSTSTPYPKDGINDHVVAGAATVNPERRGTKAAAWYRLSVEPGATVELRLRLRPRATDRKRAGLLGKGFSKVVAARSAEADEFYGAMAPASVTPDQALVMRQAFAGMLWCKQFFHYDVSRWLDGDPTQPTPPAARHHGRNARWRHFDSFDILSMPDKWEYPWFAVLDLAFHCVALAHVDPGFAKYQLLLLCREWFQHPNGALPAYEWDFGDVNPPVQAWAAVEVFAIDGARDTEFLGRVFDKLLVNFTWWVNREDADGSNTFEGGFLGLDNIGPIDRSHLPVGGRLEQSDATGWMAFYALSMAGMAGILKTTGARPATDLGIKFLEHFSLIAEALENTGAWDEEDGMFYDQLISPSGEVVPVKARTMVGIIPLFASVVVGENLISVGERLGKRFGQFLQGALGDEEELRATGVLRGPPDDRTLLLSAMGIDRLLRVCTKLFDEAEFLSPHGLRALSQHHRDHPYVLHVDGVSAMVDYEPAESTVDLFGGNSNWRGPVWMPLNYLLWTALERYARFFGDDVTIEYPTGSGTKHTFGYIHEDLRLRLISLFTPDAEGRRPCFGGVERLQTDPEWKDHLFFNEYFHGDNGAGLGACHQTGWTGVVADLIRGRPGDGVWALSDLPRVLGARRDTHP